MHLNILSNVKSFVVHKLSKIAVEEKEMERMKRMMAFVKYDQRDR